MGSSTELKASGFHSPLLYLLRPFAKSLFTAPRIPSEGLHPSIPDEVGQPQMVLLGLRLSTHISAFPARSHGVLLSHKEEESTGPGSFW